MKNWKFVSLGEICDVNKNSFTKNDKYEYINYLDTGNITENKINDILRIDDLSLIPSRAKRKIQKNDVIFSTVRPNQKHYGIIKKPIENMICSTGFAVISGKKDMLDNRFLYYYLSQDEIVNYLQVIAENSVSVYPSIKPTDITKLKIKLPEITEQRKIADILDSLSNKIEYNSYINQNLEAQAQAIFKSWFVDFEPFKNGKFIDSELGKIPEGWTVNTLSNIVYLKKGKKPKELSEIKHENYIPYLTIDALSGGRPLFCDTEKMLLAKEKDILLVMDGASSGAIFYGLDGVVASTIIKLELTNTEIREIVFAFLNYKQLDLKSHTTGSAIPHLDKDRLLSYKIALPSNGKLLRKISGTLKSLRDNIIRNRKESRRLAQLRDTLLPKLMSGEIDVSDVAV